ncbi:MAG: hypothetical protein L6Q92_16155 [Phycisphaerae bacterium]|nr:hypothetical protein [Phycisphaerae bacterium]
MTAGATTVPAAEAATIFREAAVANRSDPLRRASTLHFPNYGQVVMTGDLHGHSHNFEKLRRYAMLDRASARHVILHELIHVETRPGATDASHRLLLEAARYKRDFPEQVHFLQSNHELSQLTGHQILKNGRPVIEDFLAGIVETYGRSDAVAVYEAIEEFLASFPIAARTPNRVWLSHSLPSVDDLRTFDAGVFERAPEPHDLAHGGAVYQLVWGRRFTAEHVAELARRLDVDWFIVGHQPQETGFDVMFDRLIILASDHSHGSFLPFDLSKPYTLEGLTANIRKFAAVA